MCIYVYMYICIYVYMHICIIVTASSRTGARARTRARVAGVRTYVCALIRAGICTCCASIPTYIA